MLLKYRVHPFYTSKGGFFLVHRKGDGRCKKKKKKNKVRTSDCRRRTSMLNYFELKDIMNGLRDYFHCV